MNVKIESGANVMFTDKPIYNINGNVVQNNVVVNSTATTAEAGTTAESTTHTANLGGRPRTTEAARLRASFDYNPGGRDARSNQRLSALYAALRQLQWVAETDQRHFIELFQGGMVTHRVGWAAPINMLYYLFNQWVEQRGYIPRPVGIGLWQVVAARFYLVTRNKDHTVTRTDITPEQLRRSSPPANLSDAIDLIVEILNPK